MKNSGENQDFKESGMTSLEEKQLKEISGGSDTDPEEDKKKPDDILLPEI